MPYPARKRALGKKPVPSQYRIRKKPEFASDSLIRRQLSKQNYYYKKLAISNMGASRKRRWIPYLNRFARDKKPELRATAIWSLGAIGSKLALPTVIKALKDPDQSVRATAENSLFWIMNYKPAKHGEFNPTKTRKKKKRR
ncbi:MAG: HEAT repeat domain-containing protein [Candidatus Diapherotrites archaeon]|nr:HEAT repeat domain-containing protein [Candidatus Diapherotrites archaeon]